MESWISPDEKISKKILITGEGSNKPSENSRCKIFIVDAPHTLLNYHNCYKTIGDNDTLLDDILDICLSTMNLRERSKFLINLDGDEISAIIELAELTFDGFIYEWDLRKKLNIAAMHKQKGNSLFQKQKIPEAANHFTRGLKIINSIPIDVTGEDKTITPSVLAEINALKKNLYNNLSSCYFKCNRNDLVIDLCKKVFTYEPDNPKALYKIGVAYENDRNFEKAEEAFDQLLQKEPTNKAGAEHMANVKKNLKEANLKVNDIMKKMISGTISK